MSKEQHSWDIKDIQEHHKRTTGQEASIADGAGACIVRHNGRRNKATGFVTRSSCNHRWQAFRRALDVDAANYNWPAYESILELVQKTRGGKARKTLDLLSRTSGKTRRHQVPSEQDKSWDITADGENFQTRCTRPYWHEAHHIIPSGALQEAISKSAENEPLEPTFVALIRDGLLKEMYNLNHMRNMLILPMAREVAYALGLPRHRVSADARSHTEYSDKVRMRLDKIFRPIRDRVKEHGDPPPDYKACKEDLENISGSFRKDIEAAGRAMKAAGERENNALEDMWKEERSAPI